MTPKQLAELHARCFETPRPWRADEFEHLLESCFLLETQAGFLLGRVIADEAELMTLAVAPEARREGQGRDLVVAFVDTCKQRGAATAFLEVAAQNDAARALYSGLGFSEVGLRKEYYVAPDRTKQDAVVMRLALPKCP